MRILAAAGAAACVAVGPALGSDAGLKQAERNLYPAAEIAAQRAASLNPNAVQEAYGAARDLQEALRRAAPVS